MNDIFISYAREDLEFVAQMSDRLQALGLTVWVDTEGLYVGEEFWPGITAAIEAADYFIFVISAESSTSEWCKREADHAAKYNKQILPVCFQECDPEQLPDSIRSRQWIILQGVEAADEVVNRIKEAVGADPEWLREHTRLLVRARRWEENGEDKSLTMRGRELQEAEAWLANAADKQPEVTSLHIRFITISRKVVTKRQFLTLASVSFALVLALVLAVIAWYMREVAEDRRKVAVARQLAAESELTRDMTGTGLERSLLLAVESLNTSATFEGYMAWAGSMDLMPGKAVTLSHEGAVRVVAFSADGKYVVSSARKNDTRIWDAQDGKLLFKLATGSGVTKLAFNTDAAWLASATWGGRLAVWRTDNGERLLEYDRQGGVTAMTTSPDGRYVATGHNGGDIIVWNPDDEQAILELQLGVKITAIAFDPQTKRLAFATANGTVHLWSLDDKKEITTLSHDWNIAALAFNPEGTMMATGADCMQDDRRCTTAITVWDPAKGERLSTKYMKGRIDQLQFSTDGQELFAVGDSGAYARWSVWRWLERSSGILPGAKIVTMSPDGRWLATAGSDQTARIWDASDGSEVVRMRHQGDVLSLDFSADGRRLVTGTLDGKVFIWPAPQGRAHMKFFHDRLGNSKGVEDLSLSPGDKRLLATGGIDKTVRIWDMITGDEQIRINHEYSLGRIEFSPDGRLLASAANCLFGCKEIVLNLSDVETGKQLYRLKHESAIKDIAFSPDAEIIATGTLNGKVRLWSTTSGELTDSFDFPYRHEVRALDFSPDGTLLAAAEGCPPYQTCKAAVKLWALGTGRIETQLSHNDGVRAIVFSPEGETIATASSDLNLRLWDTATGTQRWQMKLEHPVNSLLFSPDGHSLAAGGTGGQEGTIAGMLYVFEATKAKEMYRIPHEWPVTRVAFNTSGNLLASATSENTYTSGQRGWRARIFEAKTGTEVARMDQSHPVLDIQFSWDDRWLLTAGRDNTAARWAWQSTDLIELACERLTRNLSDDEWQEYLGDEVYRDTCPDLSRPESLPIPPGKRYLRIIPGNIKK